VGFEQLTALHSSRLSSGSGQGVDPLWAARKNCECLFAMARFPLPNRKDRGEIKALQFPIAPKPPRTDSGIGTQILEAVGPPVPSIPVESIHFRAHRQSRSRLLFPSSSQFQFTHPCLGSLRTIEERSSFEVIVRDDCSTGETVELVPRFISS